jgi:7-carboxy-7-deazaguanine synthase
MQITEIFKSIQGESSYTGLPCVFVRLTGCNLRCVWCDSEYTFTGGAKMSLDEVMARVEELGGDLVEVTGGEPLLQREVYPLMTRLLHSGRKVMLETSGERPLAEVPPEVIKIVDVKCPDSGEPDCFDLANLASMTPRDEAKFVIASERDYEFARDFTRKHELRDKLGAVVFSPVHGQVDLEAFASWIIRDGLDGVRFGYQLHKIIWGADAIGV